MSSCAVHDLLQVQELGGAGQLECQHAELCSSRATHHIAHTPKWLWSALHLSPATHGTQAAHIAHVSWVIWMHHATHASGWSAFQRACQCCSSPGYPACKHMHLQMITKMDELTSMNWRQAMKLTV